MNLIATVAAPNANSFVTEVEAIAYASERMYLPTGWTTVAGETLQDTEKLALVEATRELSVLVFNGERATSAQALAWPRVGAINPDAGADVTFGPYTGEPEYADDEIPSRVKNATMELALELLRADVTRADSSVGVVMENIGGAIIKEWSPGARPVGFARFPRVLNFLRPLLRGTGAQVNRS